MLDKNGAMSDSRLRVTNAAPMGVAGRFLVTCFLSVFFLAGLFFSAFISKAAWDIAQTYAWKTTPCQILQSKAETPSENGQSSYSFRVVFQYVWEGRNYTSDTFRISRQSFESYGDVQLLLDQYPADAHAACYVNPKDPAQAILVRQHFWFAFFLIIPLTFMLVSTAGLFGVWKRPAASPTQNQPSGPLSEPRKTPSSRGFLALFFLGFFLIGSVATLLFLVWPILKFFAAKSWIETPCIVESSQVRSHRGGNGTTYSVDILYRYTFNNQEYKSNQYQIVSAATSGRESKATIVANHPPGKQLYCYVNPKHPAEAVLQRGLSSNAWLGLIPLVFAIIGLVGLIFTLRPKSIASSAPEHLPLSRAQAPSGFAPTGTTPGPVELKPQVSRVVKLVGIIILAAFWNGIVAVFVWQVIQAWMHGRSDWIEKWFLPVFLIPFVLIGLTLIGAVFYFLLGLFNPRPRLFLASTSVPLGEPVRLQWTVDGRLKVLQRLHIFLQGHEEAVYRRGTRTCTDKEIFATLELVNVTSRADLRSGHCEIRIPRESMHTFASDNNKIVWTLHVQGIIRHWPDVDDEFPFTVLPVATTTAPSS